MNISGYVNSARGDAAIEKLAKPLFAVADVSRLRAYVAVLQQLGGMPLSAPKATLSLPNAPDRITKAEFLAMAGAVDLASRTIVTELLIPDVPETLFLGTYVAMILETSRSQSISLGAC